MINNTVVLITFYTPQGITFQKCVEEFGTPDYVAQWSILGSGFPLPTDAIHIWFSAIGPRKGIVFSYDTTNLLGPNYDLDSEYNDFRNQLL